jgi:uncharacterized protein YbjQ (UPF0145 family)
MDRRGEAEPQGAAEPTQPGPAGGLDQEGLTAAQEAEQEDSLARIEEGKITVAAERRLRELRERGGLFTSDLSVAGWALSHRLGLKPLSQVMGSSIYQMGYQGAWGAREGGWSSLGSFMLELTTLSQALNEVRSRALGRLAEEAAHVGADAVVEVKTRAGESSLDTGAAALEHTVFGTAVRRDGARSGHPVLSELSMADFTKLVQAGFEPLGIVAWSSVYFVTASPETQMMGGITGRMMFSENSELREFTQGVYNAREAVMAELSAQAAQLGAAGIVGMRVNHRAVRHTLQGGGMGSRELAGLMVTFNAIGTAIEQREDAPLYPPEPAIDLTT